ncbi:hypothetical protein [Pontibacter roseus]|uniref:hypothetical protein n=1 Tax=Pontibacter roseus TaxID=336989 RepID=UPI000360BBDD|nr:hypothetical protein [Pontibacter roseus]
MILFSNGFFQLEYDAPTDILSVALPDMSLAGLSEARRCFDIMLEHVKNYHVRNLLLDSSGASVQVSETEYNKLIYQVSMALKQTRLKKVARIVSSGPQLEEMAVRVQGQVLESPPSAYQIKNFTSREAALQWLSRKASPPVAPSLH